MQQETVLSDEAVVTVVRPRQRRRGSVQVFERWCKGCGLCVAFCPQGVFELGDSGCSTVAHPERCTACEWCYVHCPDFAISVRQVGSSELDEDA